MKAAFLVLLLAFVLTYIRAELWRKRALASNKAAEDALETCRRYEAIANDAIWCLKVLNPEVSTSGWITVTNQTVFSK